MSCTLLKLMGRFAISARGHDSDGICSRCASLMG
jgi:hypothetical protein